VQDKRRNSEVVFRGTITSLRDATTAPDLPAGFGRDTRKIVVFRVSRVWKGNIGQTFEMPAVEEASACIGFSPDVLKVGNDLLVYASRFGGLEYYTSICGQHKLAEGAEDFKELGPGELPRKPKQISK
jgi:hypothetical protein